MDENRKNKNYFVSTLAKYYQEFLSTDFKKVRAPKRKFSTKDAKNRKIGLLIDKYPSLYEKFYERANKAGIEKAQFTINKNSYSTKLSELNKKMLIQEIGAIDTIYFLGKVEETVDELVEKIERVNYKLDTEKEYQIFINSIEIALRGNIIAPLIESISNHIENIQTRALDSLINIEQELADITMENFSGSVSEIFIDFLISKNREQLVENIRDYYESFNYQYFYFDYFENLQTGDAFNELREIKLNEDLIENVEFYLNFGSLNYKNYKFPLCYIPININLVEEKISISFNPQLFVNKKAIDFVLEEISRKYNKPYKSLFQERVMFLDETSVITDFLNDVIYKIQNNIEISEPVNYDKFNINFAKTSDVMISTSITLSLFDKSDESMINDYEALLTGLESENKLFELFESLVNKFIDTEPDNYINEIEDKWDETDLDSRLVYNSPLPLAEEQRKILIALKNPQIQFLFVEGPPGTGKSHTISAIAFDAILEKKSILILSDKKEALDVVENKLNEALNKARDGEEYPNPLLRLGKKENNFNKLMTGANQQKINNYIRIRKKNSSKINKEEKEIYTHLTDDISGYIKKTKTIDMNELKTFLEMEDQIEDSLLDKIEEKPSVYLESFSRLDSHITELRSNELFLKKIAENIEINFENISNFNKILKKIKSDNLQLDLVDSLPKVNINKLKVLDETINSMELMSRSLMGFAFKKNLLENLENKLNNTYSGSISLKGKKRSLIELKSFK
ncbi:AAA domain-containing protein, partial [Acidimicrobiia bacterium]|nr:AAA domain-containing protein [Acidimicrobiia bacterium]